MRAERKTSSDSVDLRADFVPADVVIRPPLWRQRANFLVIGALIAPAFVFTPILRTMGWFLQSLCHEIGHCAVAWLAGCIAVPAISLTGHSMAAYSTQNPFLAACVWAALAYLAFRNRNDKARFGLFVGLALVYPAFAWTGVRDLAFLVAGHIGELAFASYFFLRALRGGYKRDRIVSATIAWFLVGRNVWLAGGLIWSDAVRGWYANSGSFGITNDYIRVAHEVLYVELGVVAAFMLLLSLVPLPLAMFVQRLSGAPVRAST